jgi:hypothetical protein
MNRPEWMGFAWRTLVALAAVVDYFLFSTGNFSLTYSVLGGWFPITLLLVLLVSGSYGVVAVRRSEQRRSFLVHIALLAAVSVALYFLSDRARLFAIEAIDDDAQAFMRNPQNEDIAAPKQARELMTAISSHKYSAVHEAFAPTFRRGDYLLEDDSGIRYRLVLTRNVIGRSEISLRQLN